MLTELGKYIYLNSPIKKYTPNIQAFEDIARDFCTRENVVFKNIISTEGIYIVSVIAPEENLTIHKLFRQAYTGMGWDAPLLDVVLSDG